MAHFTHAQVIEPGYCEPDYWLGATMTNMNQIRAGLDKLELALDCKYVAVEAATAIGIVRLFKGPGYDRGTWAGSRGEEGVRCLQRRLHRPYF